jgi:hypothetical protein
VLVLLVLLVLADARAPAMQLSSARCLLSLLPYLSRGDDFNALPSTCLGEIVVRSPFRYEPAKSEQRWLVVES